MFKCENCHIELKKEQIIHHDKYSISVEYYCPECGDCYTAMYDFSDIERY